MPFNDHAFWEVAAEAERLFHEGHTVFQKYTCTGCGERKTLTEPNRFFRNSGCDKCHVVSNIEQTGCTYMVIINSEPKGAVQ